MGSEKVFRGRPKLEHFEMRVVDARRETANYTDRGRTHWEGCWVLHEHTGCTLGRYARDVSTLVERVRELEKIVGEEIAHGIRERREEPPHDPLDEPAAPYD